MAGRSDELAAEQAVVDILYSRLDALRARTRRRLRAVRREGPSGSPQNRSERDAFASMYEDRAGQLEAVEERLAFGRLDLADATVRYIGRIGLADDEQRSLLTDWRAPVAEPFYRATSLRPDGVHRRRHLSTTGRTVTGIEDELLDLSFGSGASSAVSPAMGSPDDETLHTADTPAPGPSLLGEGALLAALASRRTGRMADIVATIQAEQDRIIRSDMAGTLVLQGGPGTGKTAVALHRTAFLLYAHRRTLEKSGVLLIGPSHSFLRYIDHVLPSLGETGVVSMTLGELFPGVATTVIDETAAAEIKGRAIWADIVRRAVSARQRIPEQDVPVTLDGHQLLVRASDVHAAITHARRSHKPHNEARFGFVREMLALLVEQYELADGGELAPEERAIVLEDLRALRAVRVALNLAWFPISPRKLIDDLLSRPHRLFEASPELTDAERMAVLRPPGAPWTESDVPLLDEAADLLGTDDAVARAEEAAQAAERSETLEHARAVIESGATAGSMIPVDAETLAERFASTGPRLTTAERAAADRAWTYGHIVVDEAQELTPMAWRMLVRRVPTRSMTIVGDVAQTSAPSGARSWSAMLNPVLGVSWRKEELTVSYRTPAQVATLAQRVAVAAGLPVSLLTAAREVPGAIEMVAVTETVAQTGGVVVEAAAQAARLAAEFAGADGTGRVVVIAGPGAAADLRAELPVALARALGPREAARLAARHSGDEQVCVKTPREVKGLEFDAVVLVEPAEIAAAGASDLYVAMTRPTQRLVVIHSATLPEGF